MKNSFCYSLLIIIISFLLPQLASSQNGLMAEYYNGVDFDRLVTAKYVDNIEDTWYDKPPVEGINPHYCSIRWTGKLKPGKSATYLFSAFVDDGIRVWINDELIIDQWNLNDVGIFSGKVKMYAGTNYDLKVEYFNALREGEIQLLWDIEKSKEEQSWYERVFGVDYEYKVITPEYFFRPDTPLPEPIGEEPIVEVSKEEKPTKETKPTKPQKEAVKLIEKPTANPTVKPQKTEVMTVAKAQKYIPKDVQFERAKAVILESSLSELNTFANFLKDNTNVTVLIEGHTDVVGDPGQNQWLSERRANRIARYLVEKGISGRRLKTIGYGGSKPLKIPEEGKHYPKNRRVVFELNGLE